VLGANLLDSAGRPLGHQFMVKRQNGVELGLAGLWPDSLARALRADGVQRVEPGFAAARTLALMRQRAEVAGAMVGSADSVPAWGFDFLAGAASAGAVGLTLAGEAARYDLRLVDGDILSAVPVRVDLAPAAPDPLAQAVSDSIDRAVEALGGTVVAPRRGRASAEELTQMLVKGHLALKQVDAWLLDGPLFRAGWDGAAITRRDIVTLLLEPQRAMQFELPGAYLRQLSRDRAWTLVLAPGLTAARLSDENTYRVAATSGLVSRHPDLGVTGLAFLPRPLWTIAVDVIESWPDKR
jgi:hypothetical protein